MFYTWLASRVNSDTVSGRRDLASTVGRQTTVPTAAASTTSSNAIAEGSGIVTTKMPSVLPRKLTCIASSPPSLKAFEIRRSS